MTPISKDTECGRVLPVFRAQLAALRAPAALRSVATSARSATRRNDPNFEGHARARSATRRNDPNFEGHGVRSGLARFRRATRHASRAGRSTQRRRACDAADRRTELCLDVEIPLDARLRAHLRLTRSPRVRTGSPLGRGRLAERGALEERGLQLFAREPEQPVPKRAERDPP